MNLPHDVLYEIVHHLDYKSYMSFCQVNRLTCHMKTKLEQEIGVPLKGYNEIQIKKISQEVIRGSFRQDMVLRDEIYYIDYRGYLIKTFNNITVEYPGHFMKIIQSIDNVHRKQLLLLDQQGHLWSFERENVKVPIDDNTWHYGYEFEEDQ